MPNFLLPSSEQPVSTLRLRVTAMLVFLVLCISQCQSQFRPPEVEIMESDTVGYNFLQQEENLIENASYLEPLFKKLYLQRVQGGQKINIVHIGDSHILGNYLTREVRERLQRAFGDAGRGLIFPYKLAGSNGPRDYLVETNARWNGASCQRNLSARTPFGVSGFTLETSSPKGELTIRMRDTATSETRFFTKVTIFQHKTPLQFDVVVRDDISNQTAQIYVQDEYSRSYYFDRPVAQVTIAAKRSNSQQKLLTLDGIALENELSGVIFHAVGVNGAKFQDYVRAKYFALQVAKLQPDLIILSMGTNEAQGRTDPGFMYRTMRDLTENLLKESPDALIMLTTPADSYLRGKSFNPNMTDMSAVIRKFARDKGYAMWDLYNFTGGRNSAVNWKNTGLLSSDSVHYSKAGYAVQGKLLYQSLVKGYNEYVLAKQP
jgi:lysophospholipase L1-like esterase